MSVLSSTHFYRTGAALVAVVLAGSFIASLHGQGQGQGNGNDDESRIQRGLQIAPVSLDLSSKNRALVGLGSYLVNAVGGCNDCHTNPSYLTGGNPFLGEPERINANAYLGGGRVFFGPVVSRNLTPDKSGLPEGGTSLAEFMAIMRTGIDPDHAHAQLGPYLQVMPWPVYRNMTDRDLLAIYTYLSAIPCVEGDPGLLKQRPLGTRCK